MVVRASADRPFSCSCPLHLVFAGCSRSADSDKAKDAARVTVAHPIVRSLLDEDDYNGWLEASQTVDLRARGGAHREDRL